MKSILKNTLAALILSSTATASIPAIAGNVSVGVSSSNQLAIFGSNERDQIVLRENSRGQLVLIGRPGTTFDFNGATSSRLVLNSAASFSEIVVVLRSGDDSLVVRNVTANDITIAGGLGNDRVVLRDGNSFAAGAASGQNGRDVITGSLSGITAVESFEVDNSSP